ncbi:MAG: acyl-ACP--UDP-N-acetylglucosamine O-acyltransferase [Candidatus Manganitrophus sp.]|nr:MAG: acyl-ACP--UDP-N-acetylglucosamine O-acyltransferase [Candidatus Manganitrophus sp.]
MDRNRRGVQLLSFCFRRAAPQDLKYKGEPTRLKIGNQNTFREYVTLNRGTQGGRGETVIGDRNFFMAYVHVAHDCIVGNQVILANAATLAGHITIGDHAILGGLSGIHQFVKIGAYAMIGGCSAVAQDVPPYVSVAGNRAKLYGLNLIGLKRHGFSKERIEALKGAYKLLFRSGLTLREAAKQAREKWKEIADVESLVSFVEQSERGISR